VGARLDREADVHADSTDTFSQSPACERDVVDGDCIRRDGQKRCKVGDEHLHKVMIRGAGIVEHLRRCFQLKGGVD
jgi:hypothetical protein